MTLAVSNLGPSSSPPANRRLAFPDLASPITSARVQQHAGVFDQQQQV